MTPLTQKVLERLAYEKILFTSGLTPLRNRITLQQAIDAADEEPRVAQVIPALILYKPAVFYNLDFDLKIHPKLKDQILKMMKEPALDFEILGQPAHECRVQAERYFKFLNHKKKKQKSLTRTFRFAYRDIELLEQLTQKLNLSGSSETIRKLIYEKWEAVS